MEMSEIKEYMLPLDDTQKSFILHWGEMGGRWGINRAVAQVHALLLAVDKPLHAQDISETLNLARSNVSTALRELKGWDLIKLTHVLGDRREHFEPDRNVWNFLAKIADKRIEQELIPTIELLNTLSATTSKRSEHLKILINDLKQALELGVSFYRRVRKLPLALVRRLLKFDRKIEELLDRKAS